MDVKRIIRLARLAVEVDGAAGVTQSAAELGQRLAELTSNPSDQNIQTAAAAALVKLKAAVEGSAGYLSPEENDQIEEIARTPLFSPSFAIDVDEALRQNPATPAMARDVLQRLSSERDQAFTHLRQFLATSTALGWEIEPLQDWQAEVGFKIPRGLFENEFVGLLEELRFIRRFLAHLSEIGDASISDIKLSSLSTTDPIILLGAGYWLVKEVGLLTKWALEQWKTVEEIRKLRAETSKVKAFSEEEIERFYGDKIRAQIEAGIEERVGRLLEDFATKGRKHELSNALTIDLREFLGRIERGMTVEVRLISDSRALPDSGVGAPEQEEMKSISAELKFPPPSDNPVLQLPHSDAGEPE